MDSPARMPGLARFALPAALALATGCTIVHHGAPGSAENASAQKAAANEAFDAKAFVEGGWAGKIEPELVRDAVDVREVVAALKKEQEAAERKYGRRQDETALFNFIVKGRETIKAVNTESAAGYVELTLADSSGGDTVKVHGTLAMHGQTRDLDLVFQAAEGMNGAGKATWSYRATLPLDRLAFGIGADSVAAKISLRKEVELNLLLVGFFEDPASPAPAKPAHKP